MVLLPGVGDEVFEFAGVEVGEAAEDVGQVLPDVEVVAAGAGDDGIDYSGCATAAGAAEKQPVLPARGDGLHFALDGVVVYGESAVIDEATQLLCFPKTPSEGKTPADEQESWTLFGLKYAA